VSQTQTQCTYCGKMAITVRNGEPLCALASCARQSDAEAAYTLGPTRGWWNMVCWNGLSLAQQEHLIDSGYLPWGYEPAGECPRPAAVAIETSTDRAPGPRFYCYICGIDHLQDKKEHPETE
jgi:hypothetical protein